MTFHVFTINYGRLFVNASDPDEARKEVRRYYPKAIITKVKRIRE